MTHRRFARSVSILCLAVTLVVTAEAAGQPPANPPPQPQTDVGPPAVLPQEPVAHENGSAAGRGPLGLLTLEQVQQELRLSAGQRAQLREIREEIRREVLQRLSGLAALTPEQRRARVAELAATAGQRAGAYRQRVEEVLGPEQRQRMREILLQVRGPLASLADERMAAALHLTDEQKARLKAIREKVEAALIPPGTEPQRREIAPADLDEAAKKVYQDAVEQSLGILTPSQKDAFAKLQGEKFELDVPHARPAPRGLWRLGEAARGE